VALGRQLLATLALLPLAEAARSRADERVPQTRREWLPIANVGSRVRPATLATGF
jgi:hypothetical protein